MAKFLLPDVNVIAVVGVSRNPEKWGYKIFKTLLEKYPNIRIYPVNPKADEILGHKAYRSIKELPETPDIVITVVPPRITEVVVRQAAEIGVRYVWMQPGSESEEAIKVAEDSGIIVFHNICIVESSRMESPSSLFKIIKSEDEG